MTSVGHSLEDDLQLAFQLADSGAELALHHFRSGVEVRSKPDGSPVTEADRAVEQLLVEALRRARPDDAVLGEEFGARGRSDRRWVLDPVDGTRQFVAGDPRWRVQVSLEAGTRGRVAVVASPALGLCWWAATGCGAFESSWPRSSQPARRLRVSATPSLEGSRVCLLGEVPPRVHFAHSHVSSADPMPLVALVRGEVDVVVAEGYFAWDHSPWILLTGEAGGRFTDRRGGSASGGGGGVYSNATLHDASVRAMGYPGA